MGLLRRKRTPLGRQTGFTFVELLVVILIISILAAIGIAVFLRQREKGWVAQVQAALRNGHIAAESYRTDPDPPDSGFLNLDPAALVREGLRAADVVVVKAAGTQDEYCIVVIHTQMLDNEWSVATIDSDDGGPKPDDECSEGPAPPP